MKRSKIKYKVLIVISSIIAFNVFFNFISTYADEHKEDKIMYTQKITTVYKDKEYSLKKSTLVEGYPISVKNKDGHFYCEKLDGYLKKDDLVSSVNFKNVEGEYVFSKDTNIYESPDLRSKIIAKGKKDEKILYNGKFGNWYRFIKNKKSLYIYDVDFINEKMKENNNSDNKDIIINESAFDDSEINYKEYELSDVYLYNSSIEPNKNYRNRINMYDGMSFYDMSTKDDKNKVVNSDDGLKYFYVESKKGYPIRIDYKTEVQKELLIEALKYEGNPYVYGGYSLYNGIDCSGFTKKLYSKFGINIPRSSKDQSHVGIHVSLDKLQAGDLICFKGHVGMYIGNKMMIHASSPRTGIIITKINYGNKYITNTVRIFND